MNFVIQLKNVEEAKEFVQAASACGCEIDLQSGAVYLDAKSLLGVLTMGVNRRLQVMTRGDQREIDRFRAITRKYVIA